MSAPCRVRPARGVDGDGRTGARSCGNGARRDSCPPRGHRIGRVSPHERRGLPSGRGPPPAGRRQRGVSRQPAGRDGAGRLSVEVPGPVARDQGASVHRAVPHRRCHRHPARRAQPGCGELRQGDQGHPARPAERGRSHCRAGRRERHRAGQRRGHRPPEEAVRGHGPASDSRSGQRADAQLPRPDPLGSDVRLLAAGPTVRRTAGAGTALTTGPPARPAEILDTSRTGRADRHRPNVTGHQTKLSNRGAISPTVSQAVTASRRTRTRPPGPVTDSPRRQRADTSTLRAVRGGSGWSITDLVGHCLDAACRRYLTAVGVWQTRCREQASTTSRSGRRRAQSASTRRPIDGAGDAVERAQSLRKEVTWSPAYVPRTAWPRGQSQAASGRFGVSGRSRLGPLRLYLRPWTAPADPTNYGRRATMQSGSWAEWVSGIGTAASLLLGFYILLRDRRKEDRAEATQVVSWFVNQMDGNVELNVRNGATRPIVNVGFVLAAIGDDGRRDVARLLSIAPVLGPGASASLTFPFAEFHANASYPSSIEFRDASGLNWRRNVRSGRLRRRRSPLSLNIRRLVWLARSPGKAMTYMMTVIRNR